MKVLSLEAMIEWSLKARLRVGGIAASTVFFCRETRCSIGTQAVRQQIC